MSKYHDVIKQIVIDRYYRFCGNDTALDNFMYDLVIGCEKEMPIEKANRWLGYIQGVLIERGYINVEEERNATRTIFKPLDYPESKMIMGNKNSKYIGIKRMSDGNYVFPFTFSIHMRDTYKDEYGPISKLRYLRYIPDQDLIWYATEEYFKEYGLL